MKTKKTFHILLFFSISVLGQVNTKKLDSLFAVLDSNDKAMGSISIFENGQEVYKKTIGFQSIEENKKSDLNTTYKIGSVSKIFTATLIMQLIEKGELKLSDKLFKFFPEIKNSEAITIEMLLNHRSGIFNFTNDSSYENWKSESISRNNLIKKIANYDSQFAPDLKTEYSNSNYILLTAIAEKISGENFSNLVEDNICKPCKLSNTYFKEIVNDKYLAHSYQKENNWKKEEDTHFSVPLGAGGIVSTATDLNLFLNCLFSFKIVSKESIQKMNPKKGRYGFGFFTVPFYDKIGVGHTGGIDGFQSNAFYFHKENVSITYLSNGVDYPVNDIMIGALSIYFNKEYSLPEFKQISQTKEELQKLVGEYTSTQIGLKVTIEVADKTVFFKTKQGKVPLNSIDKNKFEYKKAGLQIEFFPNENKLILKQKGMEFKYIKS